MANVYYESPDAVVELRSVPARGDAALRAAELALIESLPFEAATNPVAVAQIARDGGAGGRTHVLAAADRDQHVVAICAWLVRHKCKVGTVCPVAARILRQVVCEVTNRRSDAPFALVYLGEGCTVIAVGHDRRLDFARLVGIGYQHLIESAARAIETEQCNFCEVARQIFSCGVDIRNASPAGQLPRDMLVLIQPALQRYLVETKQTLRYASTDPSKIPASIVLMGPGAAIPGFDSLFADQLEVDVSVDDDCRKYDPTSPCSRGGETYAEATGAAAAIDLLPDGLREDRFVGQLRVAISVGATIAGLLLAFEVSSVINDRAQVRAAIEIDRSSAEAVARHEATTDRAYALASSVAAGKLSLNDAVGDRPAWSVMLAELNRLASDKIRLVEFNGRTTPMGSIATINGLAIIGTGADPLKSYMDAIKASPMVGAIALGSTRSVHSDGVRAKEFSLEITISGLPLWSEHLWEDE